MKSILSFDFFQKVSVDNASKPTFFGALISITAISLMSYLLIKEVLQFFSPNLEKSTVVQDFKQLTEIQIVLNMDVYGSPCSMLSLDHQDNLGHHRPNIRDTIHKKNIIDGIKTPLDEQTFAYKLNLSDIANQVKNKHGCEIDGYVSLSKVPGNVHLSYHSYGSQYMGLGANHNEQYKQLNLDHKFNKIEFVNSQVDDWKLSRFGINEYTSFKRTNLPLLKNENNENKKYTYEYYLKVIPYWFYDESYNESYFAYQYSFSNVKKEVDKDDMPQVTLNFDFNPITMKITRKSKSWSHLFTDVCAIVGGIYVIFSILNRIVNSILNDE